MKPQPAQMSIPIHIAIDLESLDIRPSALVLSVGCAAFTVPGGLVGTFYVEINKDQQKEAGRSIDRGTIAWWNTQPDEASKVLRSDGVPVSQALDGISAFFTRFQDRSYHIAGVWGYGSDFDNAMLQDLFKTFKHPVPWSYKLNRCGRTIVKLAGATVPKDKGTQHHALDDAIWQAEAIRLALLQMGLR